MSLGQFGFGSTLREFIVRFQGNSASTYSIAWNKLFVDPPMGLSPKVKIVESQNRVAIIYDNTARMQIVFIRYSDGKFLKAFNQVPHQHVSFMILKSYVDPQDGSTYHFYSCERKQ